jgi:AraC-like DNA-binding protein
LDPLAATAQPAVTIVEITDATSTRAGIELIEQDAVQLGSAPLRGRRVIVRLGAAAVMFHSTNLRVRARTNVNKGMLAYVTFGPGATGTVNGIPVRPGLVLAAEPGSGTVLVPDAGWESITVLLPPEHIGRHLAARQRESDFCLPHGIETLEAEPEKVRLLYDWGKRLVDTAAEHPVLFNEGQDRRSAAEIELIEILLATLGASKDIDPNRSERTRQAQSRIVKAAEDYALAHIDERLYVTDLCRATAASERNLEYAFKKVMGLTPMAYLTRLRLHRVRQALLAARDPSATVSAEALKWGFWHFGEFAHAYKDCFGELPSDTPHRKSKLHRF